MTRLAESSEVLPVSSVLAGPLMDHFYFVCAVLGGTIFVAQFILGMLGFGDHHDAGGLDHHIELGSGHHAAGHHDHAQDHTQDDAETAWFIGLLSFKTVVAGLTFFGLAGLAANKQWGHAGVSALVAVLSGSIALYVVAWTMKALNRLRSDGTANIQNAMGQAAVVYLTVPGAKSGKGKVTVMIQNRTMEYDALTEQSELPTGAAVRVVAVLDSETLAVVSAPELAGIHHA